MRLQKALTPSQNSHKCSILTDNNLLTEMRATTTLTTIALLILPFATSLSILPREDCPSGTHHKLGAGCCPDSCSACPAGGYEYSCAYQYFDCVEPVGVKNGAECDTKLSGELLHCDCTI